MFEQIKAIIKTAHHKNLPFVIFRKAQEAVLTIQIQNDTLLHFTEQFDEDGYVFAPFDFNGNAVFFPSKSSNKHTLKIELPKEILHNNIFSFTNLEKENHLNLVHKTIEYIRNEKEVEKIVISRKHFIPIEDNRFELKLTSYIKLLQFYPDAYVYWWSHPQIGVWMGATPEKFISFENQHFSTMALAGTQIYNENITWNSKEIEEQAIVADFIKSQIGKFCETFKTIGPFTKKAGHLAHLCTLFEGELNENFSIKKMIYSLHPTPAVCGMPKERAKGFILQNENYDRKYYTGFLGKIDNSQTTDLYVNLRCMQWLENGVNLYIGGGITAESNAEKEWEETVNKAQVIANIF